MVTVISHTEYYRRNVTPLTTVATELEVWDNEIIFADVSKLPRATKQDRAVMAGFDQFLVQLVGVLSYAVFCIATSFIIIFVLKKTVGIRVSEREELEGLDAHEHQMDAYPDFRLNEH